MKNSLESGARPSWFKPAQMTPSHDVVLKALGAEHHCPALEASSHACKIYASRPLDCRLYPFVLTRDATRSRLLLGVDTKCPYIQQMGASKILRDYGLYAASLLESPEGQDYLNTNPGLAGRMREEFVMTHPLRSPVSREFRESKPPHPALALFEDHLDDFSRLAGRFRENLSAYHLAVWWPWHSQDVMRLWWAEAEGVKGLIFEQAGAYALALPPFERPLRQKTAAAFFDLLRLLNKDSISASRIENVFQEQARQLQAWGYETYEVEREYLYERKDLLASQRKRPQATFRPYQPGDAQACFRLHLLWSLRKQMGDLPEEARLLLRDALYLHRSWLTACELLGIQGWVADCAGEIKGYLLGVELNPEVFVILAETVDAEAPFLTEELQQHSLAAVPHRWINAMGDAALGFLAQIKSQAGPCQILPVCAARPNLAP